MVHLGVHLVFLLILLVLTMVVQGVFPHLLLVVFQMKVVQMVFPLLPLRVALLMMVAHWEILLHLLVVSQEFHFPHLMVILLALIHILQNLILLDLFR